MRLWKRGKKEGGGEGDFDKETEEEKVSDEDEESDEDEHEELTPRERALIAHLQSLQQTQQEPEPTIEKLTVADQVIDFLENDTDIDEVLSNKDKLNSLLNKVANRIRAEAAVISAEHILKSLPATMSTYAKKQVELHMMIADFYNKNQDLNNKVAKELLGTVANEINEKNPGVAFDELMKQSAKRVRSLLALKTNTESQKEKKKSPAFAGQQKGGQSRAKGETLSPKEKEMMDLIPT